MNTDLITIRDMKNRYDPGKIVSIFYCKDPKSFSKLRLSSEAQTMEQTF